MADVQSAYVKAVPAFDEVAAAAGQPGFTDTTQALADTRAALKASQDQVLQLQTRISQAKLDAAALTAHLG